MAFQIRDDRENRIKTMNFKNVHGPISRVRPGDKFTIELDETPLPATIEVPDALDWAVYQRPNGSRFLEGVKAGDRFRFLPKRTDGSLLARKKDRYIIYVLAPTQRDYDKARENFKLYEWARPVFIPTTFYLESVAYFLTLPRLYKEWEHADYVGTIAHSAITKLASIPAILTILRHATEKQTDVAAFMYRGDPLVDTAEKWHPGFRKLWLETLKHLGYAEDKILSPEIPSFYANYWAATPLMMCKYIDFFYHFKIALETLKTVRDDVLEDASYSSRGTEIAKIPATKCMEIWGVPWYPFHPFLCERLPCFFYWALGTKIMCGYL